MADSKTIGLVGVTVAALCFGIYMIINNLDTNNKNILKTNSKSNTKTKSSDVVYDSSDDESLRGYKKNSHGKTTTYFNRELSKEDKILLGDNTPKRIDSNTNINSNSPQRISSSTSVASKNKNDKDNSNKQTNQTDDTNDINSPTIQSDQSQSIPSVASVQSVSSWNQAGTWEEKNLTQWGYKALKNIIYKHNKNFINMNNIINISFKSVKTLSGEVYITHTRGKKLYLYDLTMDISFEIKISTDNNTSNSNSDIIVTGDLKVSDLSPDDEQIDVSLVCCIRVFT